ncbi:MAG: carbohydrate-binding protein [Lewinella sp.]
MRYIFFLVLLAISLSVNAQAWEPLEVNPSKDGLELNPLKGLVPLYNVNNEFPHSIRGLIVGFDSVMVGVDEFNWRMMDSFLDERSLDGRFGYLQVNVDMAFGRSDLPAFLDNVERIYYDGMDPADGAGVPSLVVNYNHPEMMAAMLTFIERFGERYNDDPRLFLVHYGLYGIFGEWDIGFGKKFIPEGEEWEMTEANQLLITNAYAAAFGDKNLLARFPENVPEPQAVGYSDGLYFGGSISDNPAFQWFFHPKLVNNNADENWKTYPIGGEVDPDVQPILWENFPNTVIGLPGVTQETEAVFELTHPTFLFQDFMFNDITEASNPTMWANALKATRRTGYTFHVDEYRLTAAGSKPTIEVNVLNTGLAPMYANWEVEYGYVGAGGNIVSLGTSATWDFRSIQPDVAENYRSFASDVSMADGTHTFVLRIINPLETISPLATPVRFDNLTQDEDEEGWLTLGDATIVDGTLGDVIIPVTDMTVTPATATMGLFDELQLVAQVFPANATNTGVTWSTNRPATAAVDQNGVVTTNTLGGEVVITATTQDGAIVREANITVESFWVIPGVVEAEGYVDVFMAQVGPTPAGEESESVLGFINDDTWMEYVLDVAEEASFVADFRASSPSGVGTINVLDDAGQLLGSVTFSPGTSNYDTYATYTSDAMTLPAGRYTVRLDVVSSDFNLNWIEFRLDPCTGFDTNLIGTACDDGDANTTNDVYTASCECEGTAISNFTVIPALIQAEDYFAVFNAQTNAAPAGEPGGGNVLGFIGDDTWMDYGVSVLEEADFVLDFRASNPFNAAIIDVLNEAGETVTTINMNPSTDGNFDVYQTYTTEAFTLPVGEYRLRLDVVQSAFNLNWIEFRYGANCDSPIGEACDDGDATTVNDIRQVNCDCVGTPATAFTDIPGLIQAEDFWDLFNAQVNNAPANEPGGGSVLGFINDDTWMEYGVRVSEEADFVLDFRASSPFAAGIIDVLNEAGETVTTVALTPATTNYDTYTIYTTEPFTLPVGSYFLRLDVVASAFNLNWIEFRLYEPCDPAVGTACDDGDANTIDDMITETCECAGTPTIVYTPIPALIEAEDFSDVNNVQVVGAPAGEPGGGDILGFLSDETWMEYAVTVSEEAEFILDVRAAGPAGVGIIDVLDEAGATITTIALTPGTANFDTYATYSSSPFTLPAGSYVLRLDVVASAFNLNWIEFRLSEDPLAYTPIPALIQAEDYSDVFNVQVEGAPAGEPGGGDVLGFIGDDTWMEYAVNVAENRGSATTAFVLDVRASSFSGDGLINILNENGDVLSSVALVPATGDYNIYATYTSGPFMLPAGNQVLRLDVVASAFNLNWIEFKPSEALPVELSRFEATPGQKEIVLEWATSFERDNDGFHLERGTNANDFTPIAWIDGAGTSEATSQYAFSDTNVDANMDYFYRLVQVDTDGTQSYSKIVTARLNGNAPDYSSQLKVYPNPVRDELTIGWGNSSVEAPFKNVRIFNAFGQNVRSGITDYSRIDLTSLPAGLYIVEVEVEGEKISRKIIKK